MEAVRSAGLGLVAWRGALGIRNREDDGAGSGSAVLGLRGGLAVGTDCVS